MNKYDEQYSNECFLLGCFIKDDSLLNETKLRSTHFYNPMNRNLYQLMVDMKDRGERVNLASLKHQDSTTLFSIGGESHINEAHGQAISLHSFEWIEGLVIQFCSVEEARVKAEEFLNKTNEVNRVNELLEFSTNLDSIDIDLGGSNLSTKNLLEQTVEVHSNSPVKGLSGINTGFLNINKLTDGWQEGELIIIAARPSVGKTGLAINCLINGVKKDEEVYEVFFSCEMIKRAVMNRAISLESGLNLMKLRNPNKTFTGEDSKHYSQAIGVLERLSDRFEIRDEYKVNDIRAAIRKTIKNNPGKKIVFYIDHLDHVKVEGKFSNKTHEVGEVIHQLKHITKDFNVPIVLLAQLNRGVEGRQDKRPVMSDLRDAGTIEQVADTIILLYRDEYYDKETTEKNVVELIFAKHREGPTGTVKLKFYPERSRYTDLIV